MPPAVCCVKAGCNDSFDGEAATAEEGAIVVVTMALFRLAVMVEKLPALMTLVTGVTAIEAFDPIDLKTGIVPT